MTLSLSNITAWGAANLFVPFKYENGRWQFEVSLVSEMQIYHYDITNMGDDWTHSLNSICHVIVKVGPESRIANSNTG